MDRSGSLPNMSHLDIPMTVFSQGDLRTSSDLPRSPSKKSVRFDSPVASTFDLNKPRSSKGATLSVGDSKRPPLIPRHPIVHDENLTEDAKKARLVIQIKQLKTQLALIRHPVSVVGADLVRFVQRHEAADPLVSGLRGKKNPWVDEEERHCCRIM